MRAPWSEIQPKTEEAKRIGKSAAPLFNVANCLYSSILHANKTFLAIDSPPVSIRNFALGKELKQSKL